jgi:hypothetical protein
MPAAIESFVARMKKAKSVTRAYFHSHWNTLEWVFTARLLVTGLILTVNNTNPFGLFLLGLGLFGASVSSQWVRSFWLNIAFAISVFLVSVGLTLMRLGQGDFSNILLYIHVLDMSLSVWLCKRITEERFYYDACPHGD